MYVDKSSMHNQNKHDYKPFKLSEYLLSYERVDFCEVNVYYFFLCSTDH